MPTKCPEFVESWSDGPGNKNRHKLKGGKLEYDSTPRSAAMYYSKLEK